MPVYRYREYPMGSDITDHVGDSRLHVLLLQNIAERKHHFLDLPSFDDGKCLLSYQLDQRGSNPDASSNNMSEQRMYNTARR
jgi:hypothetical protein